MRRNIDNRSPNRETSISGERPTATARGTSTSAKTRGPVVPRVAVLALSLMVGGSVAACGGSLSNAPDAGSSNGSAAGPTSSDTAPQNTTAAAGGGSASVEATLTGTVSGHFDNPTRGPKYACGTPTFPDLFVLNDAQGTIGGTAYSLQISINNFTGAGRQTGNTVLTLTKVGGDVAQSFISLSHPPSVVMTDKQSGTFDGDLQQGTDPGTPALHITGTFHC